MKPIRIALIGVNENSHSIQIHTRIQQMTNCFEVVGIAYPEREEERLPHKTEKFAHLKKLTLDEILNDPTIEAVAIETDEIYCTKYALMAARKGKHIHMEKPGGRELSDFEELIKTVKEKNVIFCPGYMYRYNPYVQELFSAIEKGELGQILSVEAQMSRYDKPELRTWLGNFKGGMMFFLGCHLIDLIYRIQGTPEKIYPLNKSTGLDGIDSNDFGTVVLEYPQGISFVRTIGVERGGFQRRQIVVIGSEGTWEIKPLEWGPETEIVTRRNVFTEKKWKVAGTSAQTPPFDRYEAMLTHFARCVRKEQENEYSPDYELEVYKFLLQCCGEKI